jgi:predicted Ser/Thr protein kinase
VDPADASKSTRAAKRDAAPAARGLAPGTRLGRYLVAGELGSGGMGVVYDAYDPQLERRVALKLMRAHDATSDTERLIREARAMARLSHPNVAHVYDVGVLDDQVFVAMERIDGATLKEWRAKPRGWREVVDVLAAAGRGLVAAHDAGLVHRDFKPTNVMVGCDGRVCVMDFGLASEAGGAETDGGGAPAVDAAPSQRIASGHSWPTLTATGAVMGTPAYMSPEQHAGAHVDGPSDQFSYCVTLFETLYGVHPFGDGEDDLTVRIVDSGPVAPPRSNDVPERVHAAIVRGMAAEPGRRWPAMTELLAELDAAVDGSAARPPHPPWVRWTLRGVAAAAGLVAVLAMLVLIVPPPQGHRVPWDEAQWGPDTVPRRHWNVALNRARRGLPRVTTDRTWGCGQRRSDLLDGVTTYATWEHGVAFLPETDICMPLFAFAPEGACGPLDPDSPLCESVEQPDGTRKPHLYDLTVGERHRFPALDRERTGQLIRGVSCGDRTVTVELDGVYHIGAVRLWHYWKQNVPGEYRIEAEDSTGAYRVVWATDSARPNPPDGPRHGVYPETAHFDPVATRRIRAVINTCTTPDEPDPRAGHGWLYEIEVFAAVSRFDAWKRRALGRE